MIIDANVHVTPDGRWMVPQYSAGEKDLLLQMDAAGVDKAVVVGLPGLSPNKFVLDVCRRHPERLLPVGSFNPVEFTAQNIVSAARGELKDAGFVGVKLHPRMGKYDLLNPMVGCFLDELSSWTNPPRVWICTFLYYCGGKLEKGPVETLQEIVGRYPGLTFVLAHAGGPDILRLAHAVRDCQNVFLDLSWTLARYRGSSVEVDIGYLANTFERRMMFGSDFPEVSIGDALDCLDNSFRGAKAGAIDAVLSLTAKTVLGIE